MNSLTPSHLLRRTKSTTSSQAADKAALKLFHDMAARVPAYRHFLSENSVTPASIRTIADFRELPLVDKKNYLTKYPLRELCWDGTLANSRIISVSSGSTGEPFFWPRGAEQDLEGADQHERIYRDIFHADKVSTLVVVCFSMGTWIAGSYTTTSTLGVIDRGLKLNLVTPGIDKEEAVKSIKHLASQYDQIILAGYPPFTKDIIDEGREQGIKWSKLNVKFMWAGEAFSEEWRDFMLQRVGSRDKYSGSLNIYGSADAAMLGHETPVSIALRRLLNRRTALREKLFGTPEVPSIIQYDPSRRFFEVVGSELVFSARAGIPLVRYNIHDVGGLLTFDEVSAATGGAYEEDLKKHDIDPAEWPMPFLYLKGRKDLTATIYAVNIYPENIKAALIDPKMRGWVTGKFTMATRNKSDMDQYFEINIELAKGIHPEHDYRSIAQTTVLTKLVKLNGEFRKLHTAVGVKAEPQINLLPYGDPDHFAVGVKHRWVKR